MTEPLSLLAPGPTRIMGILNVTPDSFSDGGRWFDRGAALAHGRRLVALGADIVDVGGESTRPGSERPSEQEELDRVVPVVEALVAEGTVVSVDTMRASVARASIDVGARIINDVSGGLADEDMPAAVAGTGVPFVAMHWRGLLTDPHEQPHYDDVVAEVCRELTARVDALVAQGLTREQIVLDPGFGFSKDAGHNWTLLAGLQAVTGLGHPVLFGTSRKRFLGRLPRRPGAGAEVDETAEPTPPLERDAATAATSLLAAQAGCWAVRVHDVPATRDALAVWEMVRGARAR
ncbi:dihydropteroate synthase [Ornithinimicrobium tianjinense]|uniref:Dihydropteroate synthase n=1 Tax=Ornithinimicrobium tianjinense TaxID=1195761 RepID=A0A917BDH3_9MICO|nr:dihydropteroate synthase [Ornithinimicrobium tianjinense]GGF37683.1 dihydropteroate synthase [Ornithinimicrobium tianjinense]